MRLKMRDMNSMDQAYMLDTNLFNRVVDGKISAAAFAGRRVFVIGIQAAELQATRTPERRAALLAAFEKINPATVPASSFLLGIEGAGLGQAEWNDGSGIFEKMLNRLQALVSCT